jgi:glycosyltransferase involved in cell wall biosynthesis
MKILDDSLDHRPLVVAIVPYAGPVTGGAQADLHIVEQIRRLGWEVELVPLLLGPKNESSWFPWRNMTFGFSMMWRYRHVAAGTIFLEDQALSGVLGVFNEFAHTRLRARVVVITYHLRFNLWRHPIRRFVRRLIEGTVVRRADLVVVSSVFTRREVEALGIDGRRIKVIALGSRPSAPKHTSSASSSEDRVVRLLTVGTVEPRKGLEYLLRALSLLPDCSWHLDLVGSFDPEHHVFLEELARSLHISDRVQFHGRVADSVLEEFLVRAHVYVSPSLGEGFGLAVLDAMDRGLPVVATEAGALPELVENEKTGLLVPPRNPSALAAALRRTIVDRELRRRLGQAAEDAVRNRYSWEETGRQMEAALVALCRVQTP